MALPEHSFHDDYILTPEDLTPELMIDFARHCAATENDLLKDVLRERLRIETPFPTSEGIEAQIFASIFEE
jgi:hypothetical protein